MISIVFFSLLFYRCCFVIVFMPNKYPECTAHAFASKHIRIHSIMSFWRRWRNTMLPTNKFCRFGENCCEKMCLRIWMCVRMRQFECVMSYDLMAYLSHWESVSCERNSGFFTLQVFIIAHIHHSYMIIVFTCIVYRINEENRSIYDRIACSSFHFEVIAEMIGWKCRRNKIVSFKNRMESLASQQFTYTP